MAANPSAELKQRFATIVRLAESYATRVGPFDALGTLALAGMIETEVAGIQSACHHILRARPTP
jgi:hypothetical protein